MIKSSHDPLAFNFVQTAFTPLVALALLPWLDLGIPAPGRSGSGAGSAALHTPSTSIWLTRAFEVGEMSLVYPIARSTPALIPFVAVPLLGETLSWGGAAGIAVAFIGMWGGQRRTHRPVSPCASPPPASPC